MPNPFLLVLPMLIAAIAIYASVPGLVRGLREQAPFEYEVLGCPQADEITSRQPSRIQLAFIWFALSGRAFAVTHGYVRLLALIYQLSYVVCIAMLVVFSVIRPSH